MIETKFGKLPVKYFDGVTMTLHQYKCILCDYLYYNGECLKYNTVLDYTVDELKQH